MTKVCVIIMKFLTVVCADKAPDLIYCRSNPIDEYYTGSWSSVDFICSLKNDSGMLTCDQIEPSLNDANQACTLPFTADVFDPDYEPPENGSCVNYNQYYTECLPNGPNPFKQSISFDNIASAWIAIFQVSFLCDKVMVLKLPEIYPTSRILYAISLLSISVFARKVLRFTIWYDGRFVVSEVP